MRALIVRGSHGLPIARIELRAEDALITQGGGTAIFLRYPDELFDMLRVLGEAYKELSNVGHTAKESA